MTDKFAKACASIAAVAILGFAGNAVAQEQTEEEVQTRPNPEESSSPQSPVQPGTGTERMGIIVEEQPPQVDPATQGLVRKGFNPQPEPPEKGSETMRKPDPTLNTPKLNTLKDNPNMKSMGR
jgi:hypothetical protein